MDTHLGHYTTFASTSKPRNVLIVPLLASLGVALVAFGARKAWKRALSNDEKHPPIPGDLGWPFIGNFLLFGDKTKLLRGRKHITRTKLFGKEIVFLHSPDYDDTLFRGEGKYVAAKLEIPGLKRVFGTGALVTLTGTEHKIFRNLLLPCFRASTVHAAAENLEQTTNRLIRTWLDQETFDGFKEMTRVSLENGLSFVGVNPNNFSDEECYRMTTASQDIVRSMLSLPVDLGKYSQFGRGMQARDFFIDHMEKVIHERQAANAAFAEDPAASPAPPNDVLQRLLEIRDEKGEPLSMEVMKNNMLNAVIAATETTGGALTSILLNLCRSPDVQEVAHAHVREVLGADSDEFNGRAPISTDQWGELTYIEQIILEAERIHPVLSLSGVRVATRDFDLGGYRIKAGSVLMLENLSRSKNPQVWAKPDRFDPDRFNSERQRRTAKRMVFGGGCRQCIGMGFSNFEQKVVTTLLVRDYKVSFANPDVEPRINYRGALKCDGFNVRIERRQKNTNECT